MKNFFTLLFICMLNSAWASNYYFSAVSGDDSRTAVQAKNPATPWKTLTKLNTVIPTLLPGDSVLLKRGDTFYGSIVVKKSGASGSPIVIGAYGSGNKPVITSLKTISDWVSKGNGIYESTNAISGTRVNVVLLNGAQQELGRYPNSNAANGGFLTFESHYSNTSITDNELTSTTNWTGADVVIRSRRWVIDRDSIISHSGTTITYKASSSYSPTNLFGYFIENSVKTLDKFGEWYYNRSTKKLSIYLGSNSPSSYQVQAATGDDLVYAEKANYVVFDNLNITGSNLDALHTKYGSYVSVNNCELSFASNNGINAFLSANFKVEGCTITNGNSGGIYLGYTGDNVIIRNNKILNTGTFAGMGGSGDGKGIAIHSNGSGATIEYNEIRNTGFEGICFGGSNTTVKNNYIDTFCSIKDDGGGIYSNNGITNITTYTNRKVIGNIVMNGIGAPNGAYNPWGTTAEGIYYDNGSMNIETTGNTVVGVSDMALYLHNAKNIKIANNTFFTPDVRHIGMFEQLNHPLIRDNSIYNNIVFAEAVSEVFITKRSETTDTNLFASISGNYYARSLDSKTATTHTTIKAYDPNAIFKDYSTAIRYEFNPTQVVKTIALDATYADAKSVTYSGSITLQPYSSAVLIRTGAITNVAPTVNITSPGVNATFAAPASVTINATAADANGTVARVDFYNGNTLLGTDSTSPYSFTWNNVAAGNYTITAKVTDNGLLVTTSAAVAISVYTPNVAPTVSITSPVAAAAFAAPASITINAAAADTDGAIKKVDFYNGSVLIGTDTISPYSFTWNNVAAGNYTITAKATDNGSLVTASASVAISVYAPAGAPSVSITSPVANTTFAAPASITITAAAADSNGTISKVEFFNRDTLLGTVTASPYTFTWNNVPAGNYTITAKATDNRLLVATSAPVAISVYALNAAPSVSITGVSTNVILGAPASVTINAAAADADGTIMKVSFYNADTLLGTAAASPYAFTWNNVQPGIYTITAKATDNKGVVTTSSKVTISVVAPVMSLKSLNNAHSTSLNNNYNTFTIASKSLNLKVFPNPAVSKIQISVDGLQINDQKANMSITNMSGIIVRNIPVVLSGKTIETDVSSLSAGMYVVSIVTENTILTKKFLKN